MTSFTPGYRWMLSSLGNCGTRRDFYAKLWRFSFVCRAPPTCRRRKKPGPRFSPRDSPPRTLTKNEQLTLHQLGSHVLRLTFISCEKAGTRDSPTFAHY